MTTSEQPSPSPSWSSDGGDNAEARAAASANCQTLYEGGARLFTKEMLREAAEQLAAFKNGEQVFFTTMGLDGVETKDQEPLSRPHGMTGLEIL